MWQVGFLIIEKKGILPHFSDCNACLPRFYFYFFFFPWKLQFKMECTWNRRKAISISGTAQHHHHILSTMMAYCLCWPAGVHVFPYKDIFLFSFFGITRMCWDALIIYTSFVVSGALKGVTPFYPRSWAWFLHRTGIVKPFANNGRTTLKLTPANVVVDLPQIRTLLPSVPARM